MRAALSIGLALLVLGCPSVSNPPADRCAQVRCEGQQVCNPATGACEARDAGARPDAGAPDAGANDAGVLDGGGDDAGAADAGAGDAGLVDAGSGDAGGVDAGGGMDAGAPDAGDPVDAGCGSDAECFGATFCEPATRTCLECFRDSHCPSSAAPRCDVPSARCVECLGNADCANPLPTCQAAQCVGCASSADCDPGRECNAFLGTCAPLNDTCGSARAILPSGTGTVAISGEPGQAIDDTTGTCTGAGPELVYAFTTTTTQALTVIAAPLAGSTARPAVYLRQGCTGSQLACDAPSAGAASLAIASLPAGAYFLFVESANGAPGRVSLEVSLQPPPTAAANDTCAGATPLGVNGTTALRSVAVGNTVVATNAGGAVPGCSATARASGGDLVYSYTLAARSNVTVVARPVSGSALHPVVAVTSPCDGATTEHACQAATTAAAVQAQLPGQQPGTYFVHVDAADGTSGAFQLEIDALPVVDNDACAGATPLLFTGNTATATGDTTFATNGNATGDEGPSCSDSARATGRDVVFTYTLAFAQDVALAVTPTGASPTLEPVLSVRSTCADASRAGELGCVSPLDSGPGRLALVNQPAGTYTVWVDSARDTSGPFQLEVVTSAPTPPPANDDCASAEELVFVSDVATASGSTLQASNSNYAGDVLPTCAPSAKQSGRDVVYRFTLAQPADVTLRVAPTSGSTLTPALYVRKSNCGSQLLSEEVVCLTQLGPVEATLTALEAGTYFVFVDSSGGTRGAFTLTATRSAPTPPPSNDWCSGPRFLSFVNNVATVTGTTTGATNGNAPIDNAPACGTDFFPRRFGRDLVYTYTLSGAQDLDVTITPAPGSALVPALYARLPNQCTSFSAGSELTCVSETSSRPLRVYLPNQVAGTYFLFVDSNGYGTGDFTLSVTRKPATLPPANDACVSPAVVASGATGVTGDTAVARNDFSSLTYGSACRTAFFDGRDLVYQYTPAASGPVTATLSPEAAFDGALLLLQGSCAPASCVRAADSGGAGVPESVTFDAVAGQTVWLVVDSRDRTVPANFGAFTLRVTP
jgi:hypothetical protein